MERQAEIVTSTVKNIANKYDISELKELLTALEDVGMSIYEITETGKYRPFRV